MSVLSDIMRGAASRSGAAVGRLLQQEENKRQTAARQAAFEQKQRQAALDRMFNTASDIASRGGTVPSYMLDELGSAGAGLETLSAVSQPDPKTGTIPEGYMFDGDRLIPIPGFVSEPRTGPIPEGYMLQDGQLVAIPGFVPPTPDPFYKDGGMVVTNDDGSWSWSAISGMPTDSEVGDPPTISRIVGNLMIFNDGSTLELDPAQKEAAEAHVLLQHNLWLQKEGTRQKNRMGLVEARYWQSVNLKMRDAVMDAQRRVEEGTLTMEEAEDAIRTAAIGMNEKDADSFVASAMPFLADNELKIEWNPTAIDKLTNINAQIYHAQHVIELGQNDIVMGELGKLSNVWSNIDEYLGGEHFSEETRRFLYHLKNTQDALQRSRTGAAISEYELGFYNSLFGTVYTNLEVIEQRMGDLQDFSRTSKDAMWSTRLDHKYEGDPAARERAWRKYEERERRMLGRIGADREGPTLQSDTSPASLTDEDIDAMIGGGT